MGNEPLRCRVHRQRRPCPCPGLCQDALRLAQETHQLDDEAPALEGTGECELRAAGAESGIACLKQAIEIIQRLAMKPDADRVGIRLAQLYGCSMDSRLHR